MKVGSLPLTRVQIGENWYAINRLGYNRLVSQCWGVGIENPECEGVARLNHITLTRVMEKPSLLSICCLREVVRQVWGDQITNGKLVALNAIFDCGCHFRSYRLLDWILADVPIRDKINTSAFFGEPHHMKGPCDGIGGELHTAVQLFVQKDNGAAEIHDLDDLKAAYDEFADRKERAPDQPRMVTSIYMPGDKRLCDAAVRHIDASTLPARLRSAHHWCAAINDKRKRKPMSSLLGLDRQTLTGLNINAYEVPLDTGGRTSAFGTVKFQQDAGPVVVPAGEVDPEEEEQQADEEAFLQENTAHHNFWRVSYRKGKAQKLSIEKVRPALRNGLRIFARYADGCASRHRVVTEATRKATCDTRNRKVKRLRAVINNSIKPGRGVKKGRSHKKKPD